jgi:hypothetical protein
VTSGGFGVVGEALINAADGVAAATWGLAAHEISGLCPPVKSMGHSGLHAALRDFCDRWNIGVEHLAGDGGQFAARLRDLPGAGERLAGH